MEEKRKRLERSTGAKHKAIFVRKGLDFTSVVPGPPRVLKTLSGCLEGQNYYHSGAN